MKKSKSALTCQNLKAVKFFLLALLLSLLIPDQSLCILYIDINAPTIKKLKVAIPDFVPMDKTENRQDLKTKIPQIIKNDLKLSSYFSIIEKSAFLTNQVSPESPMLQDWSAIGADLLIVGRYRTISKSIQIEVRVFDVYWAKQIMGKRALGELKHLRFIIHKIDNEIIKVLTGVPGIFTTKIAFVSNITGNKEIYVSDYDGHNIKRITFYNSITLFPKFSPDGKKILYSSYTSAGPVLYLKNLETGTERIISARKGINIGGSWSPDGKTIAVTLSIRGNPDIYLIDTNGKVLKRVTRYWGIDSNPCFSPDGKKIAFVSNRSGSPQIYIHDLDTGNEERLTFEGRYNSDPAWSSRNKIAYACMLNGNFDICTINPDGTDMKRLTDSAGNDESPCWSPDGRYIIFTSNRTGHYQLYIMTANGENQVMITSLKGDQTSPCWGP